MYRTVELLVAAAIGAAIPTVAGIYFAKTPEVYVDGPEITLCGKDNDPCHIKLSEAVQVELNCGTLSFPAPCEVKVMDGDTLNVRISP